MKARLGEVPIAFRHTGVTFPRSFESRRRGFLSISLKISITQPRSKKTRLEYFHSCRGFVANFVDWIYPLALLVQ